MTVVQIVLMAGALAMVVIGRSPVSEEDKMLISLSNDSMFKKLTAYTYKLVDKMVIPIVLPIIVDIARWYKVYLYLHDKGRQLDSAAKNST